MGWKSHESIKLLTSLASRFFLALLASLLDAYAEPRPSYFLHM